MISNDSKKDTALVKKITERLLELMSIEAAIEVNEDKEKERLIGLAILTAQRAEETGKPQSLYNLTPSQRRTIHLFLAEKPNVKTESQGEGNERFLIVTSVK